MGWDQKLCNLILPQMPRQKISLANIRRNCSNNSDQKENDNSPETNAQGTEIYNLNDREFKRAIIKKLKLQENTIDSSMKSGTSSQKRLKL